MPLWPPHGTPFSDVAPLAAISMVRPTRPLTTRRNPCMPVTHPSAVPPRPLPVEPSPIEMRVDREVSPHTSQHTPPAPLILESTAAPSQSQFGCHTKRENEKQNPIIVQPLWATRLNSSIWVPNRHLREGKKQMLRGRRLHVPVTKAWMGRTKPWKWKSLLVDGEMPTVFTICALDRIPRAAAVRTHPLRSVR